MAATTPKIAIVGAGPVGLTLAAILHRNGVRSTVFERESSAAVRAQGGTLDIHAGSGQRALTAAGLLAKFRKLARVEGETIRLVKGDGTVLFDQNGKQREKKGKEEEAGEEEGRGRPEIDRHDLKNMLIEALPKEYIRWNKGIASIAPVPGTSQWTLSFIDRDDDDESGPYDLVLGADGAWSRVRPRLTDVKPLYSGIMSLDVWISAGALDSRSDVGSFIGRGTCLAMSEGRSMVLQRHSDGTARVYMCVRTSKDLGAEVPSTKALLHLTEEESKEIGEVDWTDEKTRKRFLDTHFADWSRESVDAALAMTDLPTLRPFYMLPIGHRWESRPGVSLLGDAAHLMTPFAGAGVNVGMTDAFELAEGILGYVNGEKKGADGLAKVLRTYEEGMFERSSKDAALTKKRMVMYHEPGGAEMFRDLMTGGSGGGMKKAN
ncbi:FAD/NAD(P)-binding domain-containing protein [Annulohypoxylon bovei var. microspora]|nr:FAD/NAD(P)-binding domain-containing protein [Annulohypoxylon bovei var. microspora]